MFGISARSKKSLSPLPVWDDWNERFEYEDGRALTKYAIETLTFFSSDLDRSITVDDFLKEVLYAMWSQGDDFNPKKPFGNAGWKQDMIRAFIDCKLINGEVKPDGKIVEFEEHIFEFLIKQYLKVSHE